MSAHDPRPPGGEGPRFWCRKLRWKGYDTDKESMSRVVDTMLNGGVGFTCLSTALCVGEDDELAAPERCSPSRECYDEHPLLRLGRSAVS